MLWWNILADVVFHTCCQSTFRLWRLRMEINNKISWIDSIKSIINKINMTKTYWVTSCQRQILYFSPHYIWLTALVTGVFSDCPLLLSQNPVSSNVLIQNLNYSDTLKDEVFHYGLKKLETDASLWIKVLVYKWVKIRSALKHLMQNTH